MSDERKPILYSCDEAEYLTHETPDAAIESYLDDFADGDLPETVDCYGWARLVVSADFLSPLEGMLEALDEEYAGDDPQEPTEAMLAAEKAFVAAVVAEYQPWQCEVVSRETINCREWIREHRPHWVRVKEEERS